PGAQIGERPLDRGPFPRAVRAGGEVALDRRPPLRIDFVRRQKRQIFEVPPAIAHVPTSSRPGIPALSSRPRSDRTAWKKVAFAVPTEMPASSAISLNLSPS